MKIYDYDFCGPYPSTDSLYDTPGIYIIICGPSLTKKEDIIDVGQSDHIKTRIEHHDRSECWKNKCNNTINYAAHYTNSSEATRLLIEKEIRDWANPPCGER